MFPIKVVVVFLVLNFPFLAHAESTNLKLTLEKTASKTNPSFAKSGDQVNIHTSTKWLAKAGNTTSGPSLNLDLKKASHNTENWRNNVTAGAHYTHCSVKNDNLKTCATASAKFTEYFSNADSKYLVKVAIQMSWKH